MGLSSKPVNARHLLLIVSLAVPACGEEQAQIPDGFEAVRGTERLGWVQQASSTQELATFGYLVYVDDGAGSPMQNVSCAASPSAAGFECSAALPSLTSGRHSIRVSAFLDSGGGRLESARSDALNVFKVDAAMVFADSTSPATELPGRVQSDLTFTAADATRLHAINVAPGLQEPTDLAFAPDGAVYITERAGRVLLFRDGSLQAEPAVTLTDAVVDGAHGLLAIAVDPQFARNGYVYLLYTGENGFRLARFRAAGDTLGDRAILLDGIAASSRPGASLRFGPDGRLYLGVDDGGDPRTAGDLGTYQGKVLRLNPDATTPLDQAGGSPIYAASVAWPRGFDWDKSGTTMWIVDAGFQPGQMQVVVAAADAVGGRRGETIARYNLPDGATGLGVTFYHGNRLPSFAGNLLVAIEEPIGEAAIFRLVFDPADARKVVSTERLLRGSIDGARAIGVDANGIIYFCTRSSLFTLGPG
jgi:glucose/arabinose dehydrogenase